MICNIIFVLLCYTPICITVTFEFRNISASDLGLTPSVSSLALDKHIPLWSGYGAEDMDELGSD